MSILVANDAAAWSRSGQKRLFKDVAGVLWKFYWDTTNLVYRTSGDNGKTWSAKTTVPTTYGILSGDDFAVWYDPTYSATYVWIVYESTSAGFYATFMRRGTISGNSITWEAERTVYSFDGYTQRFPVIIVLSGGGLQVYFSFGGNASIGYWHLMTNSNNDGSGTWTDQGHVSAVYSGNWCGSATPLLANKAYTVYQYTIGSDLYGRRWNGTSLDAEATISGLVGAGIGGVGLGSDGDVTCVSWFCVDRISDWTYHPNIQFRLVNADNTLGDLQQISADDDAFNAPDLSVDAINDVIVVVWCLSNNFRYRVFRNGVWETVQSWATGQTLVHTESVNTPWKIQTKNEIPLTYFTGELYPFNIYFYLFDITVVKEPVMKIDLGPHPRSRFLFGRNLYLSGRLVSPLPPLWDTWDCLWMAVL